MTLADELERLADAQKSIALDDHLGISINYNLRAALLMSNLDAIIAALRAQEWQDIATAPRDGTWFQAYRPAPKVGKCQRIVTMCWLASEEDFAWPVDIFDEYNPPDLDKKDARGLHVDIYTDGSTFTHWRPLPNPPAHDKGEKL